MGSNSFNFVLLTRKHSIKIKVHAIRNKLVDIPPDEYSSITYSHNMLSSFVLLFFLDVLNDVCVLLQDWKNMKLKR